VKEGSARVDDGGGPAGVVDGMLRSERRSGVDGGSDGTANIVTMDLSYRSSNELKTSWLINSIHEPTM
jgi:hypothetical protein